MTILIPLFQNINFVDPEMLPVVVQVMAAAAVYTQVLLIRTLEDVAVAVKSNQSNYLV